MGFSSVHTPMVWDLWGGKKRSAYRHGSSWRTGEWVEFKDALKSTRHVMRINQKIRCGEQKEGYNGKVRFEKAQWHSERGLMKCWMVYSFIKKAHWVVEGACINNVHIWPLKYAYFKSESAKYLWKNVRGSHHNCRYEAAYIVLVTLDPSWLTES